MTIMTTSDENSLKIIELFVVDRNENVVPLHREFETAVPHSLADSKSRHLHTPGNRTCRLQRQLKK